MDEDDGAGDTFVLPPVPLATGQRLAAPDGRRVRAVDVVVTTDDDVQTRFPLRSEHGAWWAPPANSPLDG